MSITNGIPENYATITPHLVVAGGEAAIAFYKKAFGAEEVTPALVGPGGTIMHADLRIGGSMLWLADENPAFGLFAPKTEGSGVTVNLFVPDAEATFARAIAAGATVIQKPEDTFWGATWGRLRDPFGHTWSIATQTRTVSPEQMRAALASMGG